MVIHEATFDAVVGMVQSNPEWQSWTMAKELRKLGLAVSQRHDLQKVRSTLRKAFKKKPDYAPSSANSCMVQIMNTHD